MVAADIPAALDLWQHTEGVGLTNEETPEMLVSFLERNPGSARSPVWMEDSLVPYSVVTMVGAVTSIIWLSPRSIAGMASLAH